MQHLLALTSYQIGELGNWGIGFVIGLLITLFGFGVIPTQSTALKKNLKYFQFAGPLIMLVSLIFTVKSLLNP